MLQSERLFNLQRLLRQQQEQQRQQPSTDNSRTPAATPRATHTHTCIIR